MSEYVCSFCRCDVHEPRHSISTCFGCGKTGIPWKASEVKNTTQQPTTKGKRMKKVAIAVLMTLCMAMACSAEPAKQADTPQAEQQAQQQAPTLEQLNAQFIYWTGAKEVMTQQAKAANEAVGAYTVQLEQIKAKIEAMQPKQEAPADKKEPAKKKRRRHKGEVGY